MMIAASPSRAEFGASQADGMGPGLLFIPPKGGIRPAPATPARNQSARLKVKVAGGGPVGLAFATCLKESLGAAVDITVFDRRWTRSGRSVVWKDERQGNRRRSQVVTIQSGVAKDLAPSVEQSLFGSGDFTVMWPFGRNSPREHGRPRNLLIRDIEDRLLDLAQGMDINLVPEAYDPDRADLGCDVLAICDGANSPTSKPFTPMFGLPDATPFAIDGAPAEDTILSLNVTTGIPHATAVALTVAQNRFLLNTHRGRGVLNVRLAPEEVADLGFVDLDGNDVDVCRTCGCPLTRVEYKSGRAAYVCVRHKAVLRMSVDPSLRLWERIQQGLRLFGVAEQHLHGITIFRASMAQRSRFSAELAPARAGGSATFGFLLGDAGGAIHIWPGRGMNFGLSTAVSLARCLTERWTGAPLRHADFARHEANMHMLQYRHKGRAWRAMVRYGEDGKVRQIAELIGDGLRTPVNRDEALQQLVDRLTGITARLRGRIDGLPGIEALRARLARMNDETLATMAASGSWETVETGGEEVDVTRLFQQPPSLANSVASVRTDAERVAAFA